MTATNGKATEEEESKINKLEPNNQEDQEETNAEEDEAEVEESKEETESAEHQQEAEYVNEGLRRWEERRTRWLNNRSDTSDSTAKAAVPLDVDEVIDLIFSQRWRSNEEDRSSFPQPVPLPQMVDILVDLWEAEGLDV